MGNTRSRPSDAPAPSPTPLQGAVTHDAEAQVPAAARPTTATPGADAAGGPTNGQWYSRLRPPYPGRAPSSAAAPAAAAAPSTPPPPSQELTKTATIRNAVNLKKSTLRLTAVPGSPHLLSVAFTFDASAPCRASVFVLATEDLAAGCSLRQTSGAPPAASVLFPSGLGQSFPPPGAAAAHAIDTRATPEATLLSPPSGVSALVVRLETVSPEGLAQGHTLNELKPGAAQPPWVQSQTTFASVAREDAHAVPTAAVDGGTAAGEPVDAAKGPADSDAPRFQLVPRVTVQKIWAGGVSYELQEIFGLEASRLGAPRGDAPGDDEDRLCVICLVNDRDTTVLPCRHMCMCHECAQELRRQTSRCPICRNHVESLLHIRIKRSEDAAKAVKA